jgi:hypothetical protein
MSSYARACALRSMLVRYSDMPLGSEWTYAAGRVHFYRNLQDLVVCNAQSPLRARGLGALFKARYDVVRRYLDYDESSNIVRRLADEEIQRTLGMPIAEVRARDSFLCVISQLESADVYHVVEEQVFDSVLASRKACRVFNDAQHVHEPMVQAAVTEGLMGFFVK